METHNSKLSKISDFLLIIFSVFGLSFLWIEFYLRKINTSFLISLLITAIASVLLVIIYKKIDLRAKSKLSNTAHKDSIRNQLIFGNHDIVNSSILETFGILKTKKVRFGHYKNYTYEILFSFDNTLSQDTLNQFIRETESTNLIIFCLHYNDIVLPSHREITLHDFDSIYSKFSDTSSNITENINLKKSPKYRLKDILCIIFNKKNSKKYFLLSLFLLLASLFTIYPIYYIVCSTTLILLSIYSRFNTRFN